MLITPMIPLLELVLADFITTLRLWLGLLHPCLFYHSVCTCGHLMDAFGPTCCGVHMVESEVPPTMMCAMLSTTSPSGHAGEDEIPPSSILGGRGGCVDMVIFEHACGHTSLDIVIADPTRVDLVARARVVPQHAVSKVVR